MKMDGFLEALTGEERGLVQSMTAPFRIQSFLDGIQYSADPFYRCPLRVLRDGLAHCFDGALFAAAILRRIGHPPLILDMLPNDRDDDHLLALYKYKGHWGAVAKSNFVGLRFREPIHRNLRELVLSYFEQYYNVDKEKTLRGYTVPLNLEPFDRLGWMIQDEPLERIAERLDKTRRYTIGPAGMENILSPMDDRSYSAGLFGVNDAGLYRPRRKDGPH